MGTLGRILVMINGVFAITFLMWGASVYTNRTNWFTEKTPGKETIGQVEKFGGQFKDRSTAFNRASARWERNARGYQEGGKEYLQGIDPLEKERFDRRDFYREHVNRVRDGKDKDGKPVLDAKKVLKVERDKNDPSRINLKPTEDIKAGRQSLESIASYNRQIADKRTAIDQEQAKVQMLLKQYEALTLEIFGNDTQKGLRTVIKEQEAVARSAESAAEYLVPIIIERDAQKDIFTERNENLLRRLDELNKFLGIRKTGQ